LLVSGALAVSGTVALLVRVNGVNGVSDG